MNKDYLTHWVIGIVCAAIWFWGDRAGIPAAAISLAGSVVPGLLGHALAYTPDPVLEAGMIGTLAPAAPVVAPSQTGRALPLLLAILSIGALLLLGGCGTLNSTIAGYEQKGVADARGANDNLVHGIEASICEVPIGAVIRNAEFVPIAKAACINQTTAANPQTLLDNVPAQPASIYSLSTPASGVKP